MKTWGSGPMMKKKKKRQIIRFLRFSFGLDECIFSFLLFAFLSVFLYPSLKHELFIEGEGCVGVRGVTF